MKVLSRIQCMLAAVVISTQLLVGQVTVAVSPSNQIVSMAPLFTLDVTISSVTNLGTATIRLVFDHTGSDPNIRTGPIYGGHVIGRTPGV